MDDLQSHDVSQHDAPWACRSLKGSDSFVKVKFTSIDSGWGPASIAGPHPESMEVNLLKPFLLSYKFNKYKKIPLN